MAKSDFIPRTDADFVQWFDNFYTQLQATAAALGIPTAQVAAINTSGNTFEVSLGNSVAADATAQQKTSAKNDARAAIEKLCRQTAKLIKLSAAFTPAIGEQLGVIGPEDTTDMSQIKPTVKAKAQMHGVVELGWTKGNSDGVNIYSQRDGDAGYVFLARDTSSPYVDNRALLVAGKPEVRRYKACCLVEDSEIGQPSDEVVVTCQP